MSESDSDSSQSRRGQPSNRPAQDRARRRFTVDALFSDTRPQAAGVSDLHNAKEIAIDRIVPDPEQPRRTFDEEKLEELASSIRSEGVLQPIVVRYDEGHDRYVIVHGERRWRASRMAERPTISAIVRDVPADRRLIHQLMENVVRDDLNAVDRAAALRALKGRLGDVPWDQVADAVGIRRSRLFQLLGTEKLPEEAQADIQIGRLSEKQSRALQGLPGAKQKALRDLMVEERLPAQTATRLARAFRDLPLPADDVETATAALRDLRTLAAADDPAQLQRQTLTLLAAVVSALRGAASEQKRLKQLSGIVAAPRFDEGRFSREMSALAKSLARLPETDATGRDEVMESLRALQETIAALLNESERRR